MGKEILKSFLRKMRICRTPVILDICPRTAASLSLAGIALARETTQWMHKSVKDTL